MDDFGDFLGKGAQSLRDRLKMDVTDLIRAVQKNDVEGVARALRAGLDPNVPDGINRLALPMAVDNNKTEIVKLLLQKGKANPNARDEKGQTALFKAVSWKNYEITQLLADAGADQNQVSPADGISPLQYATEKNYTAILEILAGAKKIPVDEAIKKRAAADAKEKEVLENKAIVRENREDDLARHQALKAKAERKRQAKEVAEKEAALEKVTEERKKKEAATSKLSKTLEGKYEIKAGNYLPALLEAVKAKDNDATRIFISKVKDLNVYDETHKTTILMLAVQEKLAKLSNFLVGRGADPFLALPDTKETPLGKAVETEQDGFIRNLIKTDPDKLKAFVTDKNQKESLLFKSVQDPQMFDALLEAGADVHFGGTEKRSPFLEAIHAGPLSILPALKENHIDLNALIDGKTPVDWAIEAGMQSWLIGLLREGANPDAIDGEGRTPLMLAVELNKKNMVEILLEEKADPTLKNREGKTAIEVAKEMGDREGIVGLLG